VSPQTPEAPPGLGAAGAPAPSVLEGDLARFVAADVLQFLRLAGASGRLEVDRLGEQVTVAFARGRPLWASTSGRSVRLGDAMLHRGWASSAELSAALKDQRERPAERLGSLLRERGVPQEYVAAGVGEVFRRLICLLSLWPDGDFRFVPGLPEAGCDAALEAELDRLLLEGLHQADLAQAHA